MKLTRTTAALIAGTLAAAVTAPATAATQVPASFTFVGSGWGHGVGMSQWGAHGMAAEGYTYDQIVGHYFPDTQITAMSTLADPALETIRVGVMQDGTSITLYGRPVGTSSGGSLDISVDGGAAFTVAPATRVVVSLSSGSAKVVSGTTSRTGTRVTVSWNGTAANSGKPAFLDFAGTYTKSDGTTGTVSHDYKHGLLEIQASELNNDGRSDLNAVIQQRLADEYVRGIGEVPSSWPTESLKAQSVAARSYALATVITSNASASAISLAGYPKKVRAGCLCQVYSNTSDQNYVGYDKETASYGSAWVDAVNATAPGGDGQVVRSGTTVVKTFFSSSTGGKTQPANQVWGSSAPWLTTVDDHWSLDAPNPNAAWSTTLTQSTLVSRINSALSAAYTAAGGSCRKVQVADVAVATVTARYDSGAVRELTLVDSAGNPTAVTVAPGAACDRISPDKLRSTLSVRATYINGIAASTATVNPSLAATPRLISKVSVSTWPTRLTNPATYTFKGSVSPRQYATTISLRERVSGSWRTVAVTSTSLTGSYRVTWSAPTIGRHRLKLVATNSKGSKSTKVHTVTIVGALRLTTPSPVAHGTPIALSGSTVPATAAMTVVIERRRWGRWRKVAVTTTLEDGTWTFDLPTGTTATSYKLRVRTVDPRLGTVTSPSRTVAVN